MRRAAPLVWLACACNRLFGLDPTKPLDAQYYDTMVDAPFQCPPAGETPRFGETLVQAVFQNVSEYTTSAVTGRATGYTSRGVVEGPIDDAMSAAVGFGDPSCLSCTVVKLPRLTPEGDGVYGVEQGMFTGSRSELTARFSTARALSGVPAVDGAFLNEDCSRIYVSGLNSVFYAPRS